ncbi:MAG: geranylgeranyl reductase family protein [Anaerolineae bacterium]
MSSSYDVIVAGAGPAGAVTAYELAKAGLSVLILEKERLPRYKACGGGLPEKVPRLLDFDLSPTYEMAMTTGMVSYRCGEPLVIEMGRPVGWTVMRDRFDLYLAKKAAAAGAELREEQAVREVEQRAKGVVAQTRDSAFQAQVLVGADGANSAVARAVGLMKNRRVGLALEAEVQVGDAALERWWGIVQFDFGYVPWGYAWIIPKAEHLSVGVGTYGPKLKIDLKGYLAGFIKSQPALRDHRSIERKGHLIPLGGRKERLHKGRVLLVGDAGGLTDPFLGEGIYYAIKSGLLAARTISRVLKDGDIDLSGYSQAANAQINHDFKYASCIAQLFYRIPRFGYDLFTQSQFLRQGLYDVIVGALSYETLFKRILRRAPRLVLRWLTG